MCPEPGQHQKHFCASWQGVRVPEESSLISLDRTHFDLRNVTVARKQMQGRIQFQVLNEWKVVWGFSQNCQMFSHKAEGSKVTKQFGRWRWGWESGCPQLRSSECLGG